MFIKALLSAHLWYRKILVSGSCSPAIQRHESPVVATQYDLLDAKYVKAGHLWEIIREIGVHSPLEGLHERMWDNAREGVQNRKDMIK